MSSPTRNLLLASLTAAFALVLVAQEAANAEDPRYALHDKAVAAQERGDLAAAKEAYEALLKINDKDVGAREALATIEAELAAASAKPAPTPVPAPTPAGEAPAPVAADPNAPLLEQVSRERAALYAEVDAAVAEARSLSAAGRHDQSLRLLADAERALPRSAGAKAQRDNIFLARQDVLSAREAGGADGDRMINQRMREVAKRNQARVDEAEDHISTARSLIRSGDLDAAKDQLDLAEKKLPGNVATQPVRREIKGLYAALLAERVNRAMDARDLAKAQIHLKEYETLVSNKDNELDELPYRRLAALWAARKADPAYRSIEEISPGLQAKDTKVDELLVKGRARYLYGDYQGALDTYREVLQYQPLNPEAKAYQVRIRKMLSENSGQWNRGVTKGKLLELLDESWKLPEVYNRESTGPTTVAVDPVLQKLKEITVPEINIKDLPLNRALDQLVIVSQAYDKESKGVNIVPIDPEKRNPSVNITLRNVSLDRALEFVVKQVNFTYTVNDGIIEVRPDSGSSDLETDFFPLPDAAVTKMTGISSTSASSQQGGGSPFSAGAGAGPADSGGASPREVAIRNFFTRSGVSFEVQGATLAWDGAMLTATQTRRNLDRIRNILRRYSDTKQVHIEAKFIEVSEQTLNELSANWQLSQTIGGAEIIRARTGLRGVNEAFGEAAISNPGQILRTSAVVDPITGVISTTTEPSLNIPNSPPDIPRGNFGSRDFTFGGAGAAGLIGTIGSYDLNLFLRAVEQNNGSDLMSAPSLTVVDNKTATIRIVQTLRYPDSYGDVQSNVGQAGGGQNGGGAAGVTITAGTPQDFKEQDVGVILEVTPTVQQDDSIALNLKPQVIEFEGFVEYGGTSVAIQGNTTVTIPSGFFQPIFSFREVTTDVTIFDGATVVIGGLTREEVKTVNDKVPVLGDIPLLGAAFRSSGKTTSKRNLMVFVTANLISPGGSTLRSKLPGVNNGATFSNPVVVTPGGPVYREVTEAATPAAPAAPASK